MLPSSENGQATGLIPKGWKSLNVIQMMSGRASAAASPSPRSKASVTKMEHLFLQKLQSRSSHEDDRVPESLT